MKLNFNMTDSLFNMWRACLCVMHLDGKISAQERTWAIEKINLLPLKPDQKKMMLHDLEHGGKWDEILPLITDKKNFAFLLHQVRVISYLDHYFSPEEKKAYQELEAKINDRIKTVLPDIVKQTDQIELEDNLQESRKGVLTRIFDNAIDRLN